MDGWRVAHATCHIHEVCLSMYDGSMLLLWENMKNPKKITTQNHLINSSLHFDWRRELTGVAVTSQSLCSSFGGDLEQGQSSFLNFCSHEQQLVMFRDRVQSRWPLWCSSKTPLVIISYEVCERMLSEHRRAPGAPNSHLYVPRRCLPSKKKISTKSVI